MLQTVKKQMAVGVIWMLLAKLADRGLGLVSMLILARLLTPKDFGLIAMAMSIIAVLEMLGAFSFDIALIHNQKAERKHYDTAWTFKVILSIVIACLLILASKPAADFYNEPRLELIINLLTIGTLVRGFENIGIVDFRKELNFDKEFAFTATKKLISFLVCIPLALWLKNYWALIIGMLAGWIGGVVLSYLIQSYRPRFSLSARHELFNFSKWLFLNNVLFYFKNRSADFVIGRICGSQPLGIFNVGFEIATLPTIELVSPINRAVFPGYAKIAHLPNALRNGFLEVISYIALLALPAGIGLSAVAELLVPIALGPKWLDTIAIVQIFGLAGALAAMQTNIQSIYLALGKPMVHTYITGAYLLLLFPLMIYGASHGGIVSVAWVNLGLAVLFMYINYVILFRVISLRFVDLWRVISRPVVASAAMYAAVRIFVEMYPSQGDFLYTSIGLVLAIVIGLIMYVSTVLVQWRLSSCPIGPESFCMDKFSYYMKKMMKKGEKTQGRYPD